MERKLNYILSLGGVSPADKRFAGSQGEDRATAIIVTPDDALLSKVTNAGEDVFCSFDVLCENGELFEGEKKEIARISEPFYLTEAMTASGLDVIVIVRVMYGDSSIYKAQLKLYFEACPTYKTLKADKKDEILSLQKAAQEIFTSFEEKVQCAENLLDAKALAAAGSAGLAAGHLEKMIAFNQSAKESSESAAESEAAARAAAEAAEKDFETVKRLFSSATENINNHNFDPTAHADIRGLSQEIIGYVSRVNETAERTAEFAESHNIDATSHADIREQIDLTNSRIDKVEEDVNLFEKEVANLGGTEPLKLIKSITLEEDVTDVNVTFDKGLKEIVVIMNVAFDEAVAKAICCRSDGGKWYMFYDSINLTNDKRYFYAHAKELYERHWEAVMFDTSVAQLGGNSSVAPKIAVSDRNAMVSRYPKELNLFTAGRTSKFVVGSTIEIWGVEE